MTIPRLDSRDRNYLINSSFNYFQRALTATTVAGIGAYHAADRWRTLTNNQAFTVRRATTVPNSKTKYSLEFNTIPVIGGTDREMRAEQRIESIFARDLADSKVSFKCFVNSSSATEVRLLVTYANAEDNFASKTTIHDETFTILNNSTWIEVIKESISIPASAVNGISVEIILQNTQALVAGSHYIAQPKLSKGTTAQDYSIAGRDMAEELQFCHRYFEKSYNIDVPVGTVTLVGSNLEFGRASDNSFFHTGEFSIRKRISPVIQNYNPNTGAPQADPPTTSSERGFRTAGTISSFEWHWTADAEL